MSSPPNLPPPRSIPAGAWDTHHHIFSPAKFPYAEARHFTPGNAPVSDYEDFLKSLGIEHDCIAHGLSYGSDNSSLLHYLEHFAGKAKGIAVIDHETITDAELDRLHDAGVRSVRLDFFKAQAMDDVQRQIALIRATDARLDAWAGRTDRTMTTTRKEERSGEGETDASRVRWSIQIQQPHLTHWSSLLTLLPTLQHPLVIDHMALIQTPSLSSRELTSDEKEGWNNLLDMLRSGKAYIKISAPYRCSNLAPSYPDLEPIVRALVNANPDAVLWGSDWPHTSRHADRLRKDPKTEEGFLEVDTGEWVRSLGRWLGEEEWWKMWVGNPRVLYDYPDA